MVLLFTIEPQFFPQEIKVPQFLIQYHSVFHSTIVLAIERQFILSTIVFHTKAIYLFINFKCLVYNTVFQLTFVVNFKSYLTSLNFEKKRNPKNLPGDLYIFKHQILKNILTKIPPKSSVFLNIYENYTLSMDSYI